MTTDLTELNEVGPARAETLEDAGYETVEDVAEADIEELSEALGDSAPADEIVQHARQLMAGSTPETAIPTHTFDYEMTPDQRRHLVAALVEEEVNARRRNDKDMQESVTEMIKQVMADTPPYELTYTQLNAAYRATNNMLSDYRGTRGLSGFVGAVNDLSNAFQATRKEARDARDAEENTDDIEASVDV